jgi:succinate-acetate transporter protein
MGGALQVIGGCLEFFLGNTFPFVVFSTLGGFWLSFGATLQPFYGVSAAYESTGGAESPVFEASFGIITTHPHSCIT